MNLVNIPSERNQTHRTIFCDFIHVKCHEDRVDLWLPEISRKRMENDLVGRRVYNYTDDAL